MQFLRSTLAAVATAWHLIRSHLFTWVVVVIAVQGLMQWVVLPLLMGVYGIALRATGVEGINGGSIPVLLGNPLSLLALIGFLVVGSAFVFIELAVYAVVAHQLLRGDSPTFSSVAAGVWRSARKLWFLGVLGFIGYGVLLVPLSGIGVSSELTWHVSVPQFISGELMKTTSGTILYTGFVLVVGYAALLLCQTMVRLTGSAPTLRSAMAGSVRSMWFRRQFPVLGVLAGAGLAAAVPLALVALVGWLIVLGSGSHGLGASAVMLTILDGVRSIVGGCLSAFVTCFLLAVAGDSAREQLPAQAVTRKRTRIIALALAGFALVAMVPRTILAGLSVDDSAALSQTLVIAHRGDTSQAVENSLAGIDAAAANGADMVEMDIQETADQQFVVLHDTTLSRMAGINRNVYDMTLEELRGVTLRQGGRTATIPTLAEFSQHADERGIRMLVEVKPHGHEAPDFVARLARELATLDPDDTDMVQSLDGSFVEQYVAADPDRSVAFVVGFQVGGLPRTTADTIAIEDWSYNDAQLVTARATGKQVLVWTPNTSRLLTRYLDRGVDGVITDQSALALRLRERAAERTPAQSFLLAAATGLLP